jgi:hypothetical protein
MGEALLFLALLLLLLALGLALRSTLALSCRFLFVQRIQMPDAPFAALDLLLDEGGSIPPPGFNDPAAVPLVGGEWHPDEACRLLGGPEVLTFGPFGRKVRACSLSRSRFRSKRRLGSHSHECSLGLRQLTSFGVAPDGVQSLLVLGQSSDDACLIRDAETVGDGAAMMPIKGLTRFIDIDRIFDTAVPNGVFELG